MPSIWSSRKLSMRRWAASLPVCRGPERGCHDVARVGCPVWPAAPAGAAGSVAGSVGDLRYPGLYRAGAAGGVHGDLAQAGLFQSAGGGHPAAAPAYRKRAMEENGLSVGVDFEGRGKQNKNKPM